MARTNQVPQLGDIESRAGLRTFVRALQKYLEQTQNTRDTFEEQVAKHLTPLTWAAPIAAAATIAPLQPLQPLSGTANVATIQAGPGSHRFVLLAEDGFALVTGGNIAAAATVGAGTAIEIFLNFTDNLWYPSGV